MKHISNYLDKYHKMLLENAKKNPQQVIQGLLTDLQPKADETPLQRLQRLTNPNNNNTK